MQLRIIHRQQQQQSPWSTFALVILLLLFAGQCLHSGCHARSFSFVSPSSFTRQFTTITLINRIRCGDISTTEASSLINDNTTDALIETTTTETTTTTVSIDNKPNEPEYPYQQPAEDSDTNYYNDYDTNVDDNDDDVEYDVENAYMDVGAKTVGKLDDTTTNDFTSEIISSSNDVADTSATLRLNDNDDSNLRSLGKDLHDQGRYADAARVFAQAAEQVDPDGEDWATCKLHQALCLLKEKDYFKAKVVCAQVLEIDTAPALRARALHRKAKAALGLNETDQALTDARSAAFLGDRRAVALYGKLMRETSTSSSSPLSSLLSGSDFNGNSNIFDDLTSSGSLFESLLGKSSSSSKNPFTDRKSSFDKGSQSSPSLGLDSLLPISSLLGNINKSGSDSGSLAQSVLSSLTKRLEDESTQDSICQFLQGTSSEQLTQMAQLAGVPLPPSQASRIASFCHSITPKTLKRTLKIGKRITYAYKFMRKLGKLFQKYRSVIIMLCIASWTKSAILRPLPTSKRAAAKLAQAAAAAAAAAAASTQTGTTPATVILQSI